MFMEILEPGPVALCLLSRVKVTGVGENTKVTHKFRKQCNSNNAFRTQF